MNRYFIYLAYNGANYCGWQTQPNGLAVQEAIEKALSTLLRIHTPIVGAGRTDAGVHARSMVAHFDGFVDNTELLKDKMNRILANDIVIYDIVRVTDDAHARFDASSRLYRYYVTTRKDPFMHPYKYKVHGNMDIDMMNKCAKVLFEYEDFTSFSKLHTDVKTNNCCIMQAEWTCLDENYVFTVQANRFLRNMVRAIVGTLLQAGRGKLDEQGMRRIIESKDRSTAGLSVPAQALFLEEIDYPSHLFLKDE